MGMDQKRTRNAFVGSPVERIEDFRFLRGRGQFVDDLARDDLLHAVILRSSVAHGRIRGIDDRAPPARGPASTPSSPRPTSAPAIPRIPLRQELLAGVRAVRAAGHRPRQGALCRRADRGRAGRQRRRSPRMRSTPSRSTSSRCRAVVDSAAAGRNDILLFEAAGSNLALTLIGVRGDADAAFNGAAYVRRERFTVQRHRRRADGAARAAGGMGCGGRPTDRPRRRQGRVPQPAHAGEADSACPKAPSA